MEIKGLIDEDFSNYKEPSMFVIMPYCTFKCEKESGVRCCQNSALAKSPVVTISSDEIIKRFCANNITKAIVFGGLEPMDSFQDLGRFVRLFRDKYHRDDTIVIYTGYNPTEIATQITLLAAYRNIIIKFGRYIPNATPRYDEVLGVELASNNQYAVRIS